MASLSIPNSFTNGSNADALQVNANFAAVATFANTETIQRDASVAFTAVPSGPATDPTTGNQLTRKSYVDASVAAFVPAALSIGLAQLAANSVNSSKIVDASIAGGDIAAGTILGSNIAALTILGSNIAAGTVTSSNILDGTITGTDIAATTITGSNIAANTVTATNTTFGGAWVSQAITFTNITGGAGTCFTMLMGKTLFFRLEMTAGTVTADGVVTINLTGVTFKTGTVQPISAYGLVFGVSQITKANANGGSSGLVFARTNLGANWVATDPVTGIKANGVVEID